MAQARERALDGSNRETELIRPLRKFLRNLSKDITQDDLQGLTFMLKISDVKNPIDVFGIMMKRKLLAENQLKLLTDLLSEIGREDLSQRVDKFSSNNGVWSLPSGVRSKKSSLKGHDFDKSIEMDFPFLQEVSDNEVTAVQATQDSTAGLSRLKTVKTESEEKHEMEKDDRILQVETTNAGSYSFLEKFRKKAINSKKATTQIELHNYQRELAKPGLEGKNCIICAPTGSGKTITAGFVCQQLQMKAKQNGRTFKALFIVCIRNLIQQQRDALSLIVTKDCSEEAVVGVGETIILSEYLKNHDVIVLTAQILVNSLQTGEVTLNNIDLLIIDECHHTTSNHPYNIIMREYLKSKKEFPDKKLPQIIGLTASLGVGTSTTDPLLHYVRLCAALDCGFITHVKDNLEELLTFSPRPTKDQIIAVKPRDPQSPFFQILKSMISKVEKLIDFPLATQRHTEGSQQYENWVVDQMKEAEKLGLQDTITGMETLRKLNVGLMTYDDLRAKDAKEYLDEFFRRDYLSSDPIKIASKIHQLYVESSPLLDWVVEDEKITDNAKLQKLCDLLENLYHVEMDSRGILLTRTRYEVEALHSFVREIPQLKGIVFPAKLVGQGQKEGTMTDVEQQNTLRLFRLGRDDPNGCNLLVATDVAQEGLDMPKCNFVIRYNFVSNEIGSVQSKGRARAPNSECYLIVNQDSVNEKREYENLQKEHQMMLALSDIDALQPEDLNGKIQLEQTHIWEGYLQKMVDKKTVSQLLDSENVYIHCRNCQVMLCKATDMRMKLQNYICVAPDLDQKIFTKKNSRPTDFRYDTHIGISYCKNPSCQKKLGPQVQYKQGLRQIGFVFGKESVTWRVEGEEAYYPIKKWSKVPFEVKKENF